MRPYRVVFMAGSLRADGFGRSLVSLVRCLHERGVVVDLMVMSPPSAEVETTLPVGVRMLDNALVREYRHIEGDPARKLISAFRSGRIFRSLVFRLAKRAHIGEVTFRKLSTGNLQRDGIRRAQAIRSRCDLTEYDCVVSWEEGFCNYLLALNVDAIDKIGYIHPDYSDAAFDAATDSSILGALDKIAVVSDSARHSLIRALPEFADKVVRVNNVLDIAYIRGRASVDITDMDSSLFTIVTVCRLQNVSKALDRAVRVSARLQEDGLRFRWYVIGEGADRRRIEALIRQKQLVGTFVLLGFRDNPYPYMRKADLFVLQSKYEGRPLVVDEAMIVGTPVLVTDYRSAREQVIDGTTGFVVANECDAIASRLRDVIRNPELLEGIRNSLRLADWRDRGTCNDFVRLLSSLRSRRGDRLDG